MKELGLLLLLVGLISLTVALLNPTGQYVFLQWMSHWGPNAAWAIRGGIALLGLVLWRIGSRRG